MLPTANPCEFGRVVVLDNISSPCSLLLIPKGRIIAFETGRQLNYVSKYSTMGEEIALFYKHRLGNGGEEGRMGLNKSLKQDQSRAFPPQQEIRWIAQDLPVT